MLRQRYTARPGVGGGYIFRGDYDITEPGKDASLTTVDLADWRASLRHPGTKIQLTAILYGTELKKMEDAEEGLECPGCKERLRPLRQLNRVVVVARSRFDSKGWSRSARSRGR